jgi:ribosomal protein L16 Arg81 hydroxylase
LENISALAGAAVRQHLILLLAAQHLPRDLFADLCRHIENLFFCYVITREPTKMFERNFARWSLDLRAVNDAAGLKGFVEKYVKADMASRATRFDFAIAELTQSRIQQYRLRYILAKLTQYVEEKAWGNPAHASLRQYLDAAVHVEHILPQTPTPAVRDSFDKADEYDSWVERLGNLTLLEKTINGSVSNEGYVKKKPGYAQSSLLLTKSLATKPNVGVNTQLNRAVKDLLQFDEWNSSTILKRQQMFAALARCVWMPDISQATG